MNWSLADINQIGNYHRETVMQKAKWENPKTKNKLWVDGWALEMPLGPGLSPGLSLSFSLSLSLCSLAAPFLGLRSSSQLFMNSDLIFEGSCTLAAMRCYRVHVPNGPPAQ